MSLGKPKYKPGRDGQGSIKITTQPVRLPGPAKPPTNGPVPPHAR